MNSRGTFDVRGSVWVALVGLIACGHAVEPDRRVERPVPVVRGPELAVGWVHSCAIRCDGEVWCWGEGRFLGQANEAERRFPVEVALSGARAIAAGIDRTCAIVGDERSVVCWGMPSRGLPDPRFPGATGAAPAEVGVKWATELSLAQWDSCAMLRRGTSEGGSPGSEPRSVCWGLSGAGQEIRPDFYEPWSAIERFKASYWGRCAQGLGVMECWSRFRGRDRVEQTFVAHPITEALALGRHGFCQITSGRRVACSRDPDQLVVVDDPRLVDIVSLHVGYNEYCAVDARGAVHCWDSLQWYYDGTAELQKVPFAQPVRTISLGFHHGCGVTTGGQVLCWGSNRAGQLGDGGVEDSVTPVPVVFPEQCS